MLPKDENAGRNNPRAIFMGKDDFVNIIVSVIYYILNGVSYIFGEYSNILEGNESDYKSNLLSGLYKQSEIVIHLFL